ncbi:hypothetical protein EF294_06115 [Gordonia oryzae]|uniref:Uncharacterized protein n=2 Tax=Gordonia oryzae TaxID=2487349 RepID=A0A3N4GP71_9ACTN|nr:hypothetical protein EF294_06115 [Gordonia oryzae]
MAVAALFIVAGIVGIVVALVRGEPEALIPIVSLQLIGAALLLLATGRPDTAETSTYFSVARGSRWWQGLKLIAHLCAFVYAWIAIGALAAPSWAQISPSIRSPLTGVACIFISLISFVGSILMDINYVRRPAIEISAKGVTVQYFRRRLHIPLAGIGRVSLFPQGAGEIYLYPSQGYTIQREVGGNFEPSIKQKSIPIYVMRNGITAEQLTQSLARFAARESPQ